MKNKIMFALMFGMFLILLIGFTESKIFPINNSIIIGAPYLDIGTPTVFNNSGTLSMLVGNYNGVLLGYSWNGTGWDVNSTVNASLPSGYLYGYPTTFNNGTNWILIYGSNGGGIPSWFWNGTGWRVDNHNNSLPTSVEQLKPTVFYKGDSFHLILGDESGAVSGFTWNGTDWKSNYTVNNSLSDIGARASPSVFNISNNYYMLAETTDSTQVNGYYLNGISWEINTTINNSDISWSGYSPFSLFNIGSNIHLMTGNAGGVLKGYQAFFDSAPTVTINYPLNGITLTNDTINFSITGQDDYNLTKIELYGNFTGSWALNATNSTPISNNPLNITLNLASGIYKFGVCAYDNDTYDGNAQYTCSDNITFGVNTNRLNFSVNISNFTMNYNEKLIINFSNYVLNADYINISIEDSLPEYFFIQSHVKTYMSGNSNLTKYYLSNYFNIINGLFITEINSYIQNRTIRINPVACDVYECIDLNPFYIFINSSAEAENATIPFLIKSSNWIEKFIPNSNKMSLMQRLGIVFIVLIIVSILAFIGLGYINVSSPTNSYIVGILDFFIIILFTSLGYLKIWYFLLIIAIIIAIFYLFRSRT